MASAAMHPIAGDPVTIDSGKVAGTTLDSGAEAYLAVPFAAPPVRELRWHAPMPVSSDGFRGSDTRGEAEYEGDGFSDESSPGAGGWRA